MNDSGRASALPFFAKEMLCTMEDSFDYQVLNLTQRFYNDYPDPPFTEILRKNSRPYNCLLIQSHYGYFIYIP